MENPICKLFNIQHPIIQGGMVWASGWRLAAAVSKEGGLGLIGSASMTPDVLITHIHKAGQATHKPVGVNIVVANKYAEQHVQICIQHKVPIVFTAAGSARKFTEPLKKAGITVAHVVPSPELTQKAIFAGVDAVVAEGVEAGGHNGRDGLSSFVLWPAVAKNSAVPVIGAGGIADAKGVAAAMALGVEGVQLGTRFATTVESTAALAYKLSIVNSKIGDTVLFNLDHMPIRALKNRYVSEFIKLEKQGASIQDRLAFRGKTRSRLGIFEGDTTWGEMEAGQVSGSIQEVLTVSELMQSLLPGL